MISELVPVRFDPSTALPDDWTRFHALRRARRADLRPEDPLRPDEIVEANMKKTNPFDLYLFFEMSRDGVTLSNFRGELVTPENPEYATNKHILWADAYVRPEHRRHGVGKRWLPLTARLMEEHGCTLLSMSAENEAGHAFLRWLGAQVKMTEVESRLDLSQLDWAMVERWVTEGQARTPQTRLEIHDGHLPEHMWSDFAAQRSRLLNTMPFEDLEIGEIVVTAEKIRDWVERLEITKTKWHNVLTREPDGTISGMTDVEWSPYSGTRIEQQFTGVFPAARGRGIGKWIKAAMLLHLRELYPEARWVVTENAHSNAPMLKINRDLGFRPFRTSTSYQMTRQELEARIRTF